MMVAHSSEKEQVEKWQLLYDRVTQLLEQFGEEDGAKPGDYWVHDSYWGYPQVKVFANNLALLDPLVIKSLQDLLTKFPGWEIVVAVSVRGAGEAWPNMGLTIRKHEIIDGLHREYFPKEFQNIKYAGSRQGTDRD